MDKTREDDSFENIQDKDEIFVAKCFQSCPLHPLYRLEQLAFGPSIKEIEIPFKCQACARAQGLNLSYLMSIEAEIKPQSDYIILPNWPANDEDLMNRIMNYLEKDQEQDINKHILKIKSYYKDLISKVTDIIFKKEQEDIEYFKNSMTKQSFLTKFKSFCKKKELQDLIKQSDKTLDDRNKAAKILISSILNSQASIQSQLEQILNNCLFLKDPFDFETSAKITSSIISSVESFSVLKKQKNNSDNNNKPEIKEQVFNDQDFKLISSLLNVSTRYELKTTQELLFQSYMKDDRNIEYLYQQLIVTLNDQNYEIYSCLYSFLHNKNISKKKYIQFRNNFLNNLQSHAEGSSFISHEHQIFCSKFIGELKKRKILSFRMVKKLFIIPLRKIFAYFEESTSISNEYDDGQRIIELLICNFEYSGTKYKELIQTKDSTEFVKNIISKWKVNQNVKNSKEFIDQLEEYDFIDMFTILEWLRDTQRVPNNLQEKITQVLKLKQLNNSKSISGESDRD